MNVDPDAMVAAMANTVDERISVSFQFLTKAITKAVINVANAVNVRAIFSEIPSCTRFVSAVMRVVISPAPSLSKNAMF